MLDYQHNTRTDKARQAQSLTKTEVKVAAAIFGLLGPDGTADYRERQLADAIGRQRRVVQDALAELESKGVCQLTRARGGSRVRWLVAGRGPWTVDGKPPRGFPCPRPSTPAPATNYQDTKPEPETRVEKFRHELDDEGRCTLDRIHAERAAARRETDALWRELEPEKRYQNLAELASAIARVTRPDEVRNRMQRRAAEPAPEQRGWHPDLTDAEIEQNEVILAQLRERFGGDDRTKQKRLLRQRLREGRGTETAAA